MEATAEATLSGYLDKKGWLAWSRRWWALRGTMLAYYKTAAVRPPCPRPPLSP